MSHDCEKKYLELIELDEPSNDDITDTTGDDAIIIDTPLAINDHIQAVVCTSQKNYNFFFALLTIFFIWSYY